MRLVFRSAAVAAVLFLLALGAPPRPAGAAPVVPGVRALLAAKTMDPAVTGAVILGELGCASCHRAEGAAARALPVREAPRLDDVAGRVTAEALRRFIADPDGAKPGTMMPDLLAAHAPAERDAAVDRLVHFLASLAGPFPAAPATVAPEDVDKGRKLFNTVGCVACHGPEPGAGGAAPPPAPPGMGFMPLGDLAIKTNVAALAAFLRAPARTRPAGRMPDLRLDEGEAHALAVYLLRGQVAAARAKGEGARVPGIAYAYYETEVGASPPPWKSIEPQRRGHLAEIALPPRTRGDGFAVRFEGTIEAPHAGRYVFATESDDGSELFIDGKRVVENHGEHPMQTRTGSVELEAGPHALVVGYWQAGGQHGLKVTWEGPGFSRRPIPGAALTRPGGLAIAPAGAAAVFRPDRAKAEEGRKLFSSLGCAACHKVKGVDPAPSRAPALAALASLRRGCVAEAPARGAPWFPLAPPQRAAVEAAFANRAAWTAPGPAAREAFVGLARRGCLACHRRDGVGGPPAALDALFVTTSPVDLGDEGRLPPALDGVGSKLKRGAFDRIVLKAELLVRPYMAARMPTFAADPGFGELAAALAQADARPDDLEAPPLHAKAAEAGRRLAGTSPEPSQSGLGCITCHNVAGTPATGAPGPDLAVVSERLNPGWFRRWLVNPNAIRDGTRMPAFWGDDPIFPEVEDGNPDRQRAALWAYVSLGRSMPLPSGMVAKATGRELVPADRPVIYRTYARGASPRAVVVGYPEKVHVAFDANVVRLARAWRGRFWDASGTWTGRSGNFNAPLGTDIVDMPPGPAVAVLDGAAAPWPRADLGVRDVGGRFRGYRLDPRGVPTFLYRLGDLDVTETARPVVTPGGAVALTRRFTFEGRRRPGLHVLAASGRAIERRGGGTYVIDGKLTVTLRPEVDAHIHDVVERKEKELRVAIPSGAKALELELAW